MRKDEALAGMVLFRRHTVKDRHTDALEKIAVGWTRLIAMVRCASGGLGAAAVEEG
jgi:hypothetical protein